MAPVIHALKRNNWDPTSSACSPGRDPDGTATSTAGCVAPQEDRRPASRGYQAVQLDYRGGNLCMLVFLPDRQNGLCDLEQVLSGRALRDTVSRMRPREVELFLPRFRSTWGTFDVRLELAALGMPLAFSRSQADFSGINGRAAVPGRAVRVGRLPQGVRGGHRPAAPVRPRPAAAPECRLRSLRLRHRPLRVGQWGPSTCPPHVTSQGRPPSF